MSAAQALYSRDMARRCDHYRTPWRSPAQSPGVPHFRDPAGKWYPARNAHASFMQCPLATTVLSIARKGRRAPVRTTFPCGVHRCSPPLAACRPRLPQITLTRCFTVLATSSKARRASSLDWKPDNCASAGAVMPKTNTATRSGWALIRECDKPQRNNVDSATVAAAKLET